MSQTIQPCSLQPSTDSNIEQPITVSSSSASPVKNSSQNVKPQEQAPKPQQGSDSDLEEGEIIVKQVHSHTSSSEESSPERRVTMKSRSKPAYKERGKFRDDGKRDFNSRENTKAPSMNKYYENKGPQKHQPYYEQSKPYYYDQRKPGPANIQPQNADRSQRTAPPGNQRYVPDNQNQRNSNNNPPPYTSFANQNTQASGPYSGNQQPGSYTAPQNQPPQSTPQPYYQNTQPYYSNNPPTNVNMSHNNPPPFQQGPPQNFNNMQNFQKPPNNYQGPQGVIPNQNPQNAPYYNPPQQQQTATALGFNIQYGVNQNNQGQPPMQQQQQQFMNAPPQMAQGNNMNQSNLFNNSGTPAPYYQNVNQNPPMHQQQQQPGLQPFNVQNPHMLPPQQQGIQNLVQPQIQDQKQPPYYQNQQLQQQQQQQQQPQNINQGYYRPPQYGNNPPFNAQPQSQPQVQMQMQQQPQLQPQMQPQLQGQMQPQLQPQMQPQLQGQMQPQLQPQMQSQMQPQLQPQMQPQMQLQQQQFAQPQFSPRQPYQMGNVNMNQPNPTPSGPHQPFVMQPGSADLIIKTPYSNNFNLVQAQAPGTTFPSYYQPPFNKPPPNIIPDQSTPTGPLPINSQETNVKPLFEQPGLLAEPSQIPQRPQSQPAEPEVVEITGSPSLTSKSKSVPPPPDASLKPQEKKLLPFFIDSVPIGKVTVDKEEEKTKKVEAVKTIETEEKQYRLLGHDRSFRTQEKNLLEKLNKFLIPGEAPKEEKKKEPVGKSDKEKESLDKEAPESKEKEEEIDDFNFESRYFMYNPTQVCNRCKKPGHFERMCTEDVVLRCMFCLGPHRIEECNQIVCFNCYGVGHRIRDCTMQEPITCYRCGKKGHKNTRCGVLMPRDREHLKREKKDYNISTKCCVCGSYGHPVCQKNPLPTLGGGYLDDMYIEESVTESIEDDSLKRANSESLAELESTLDISPKKRVKTDKKDSINREVSG